MTLGREGISELYHVYGEHEVPAHDDWSGSEQPTRELSEPAPKPPGERRPAAANASSGARARTLRRVAAMALLGAGVGVVATLALHSLRSATGGEGRGAGRAGPGGAASLPPHAPLASIAPAPAGTPRNLLARRRSLAVRRREGAHLHAHPAAVSLSASAVPAGSSLPVVPPPPSRAGVAAIAEAPLGARASEFGFEG